MALNPADEFRTVTYTVKHDRASLLCRSTCGPIQVSVSVANEEPVVRRFFRPESPIYNIENDVVAGNIVVNLRDTVGTRDVIVVTFCNNSRSRGVASVSLALNDLDSGKQLQFQDKPVEFALEVGESVSAHIVLNR